MKRYSIFVWFCLLFSNTFAQWIPTNGPRMAHPTTEIFALGPILMASSQCAPFYSTDQGDTWKVIGVSGAPSDFERNFEFLGNHYVSSGWYYRRVIVNGNAVSLDTLQQMPSSPEDVAADSSGIYAVGYEAGLMWSGTGNNFSLHATGLPRDTTFYPGGMIIRLYAFSVALNSTSVFVGTSKGVYRAPKGQLTFTPLNNGLPTEDVYALYCEDSMMLASVDSSLYRSTDSGNSWTLVPTPIQRNCRRLQQVGDTLFAALFHRGAMFSTDDGVSWAMVNATLQNETVTGFETIGGELFCATYGGLFKGVASSTLVEYNGCGVGIYSMTKTDNCIAAATRDDTYVSSDLGDHWRKIENPNNQGPAPMVVELNNQLVWGTKYTGFNTPLALFSSGDCATTLDTTIIGSGSELTFLSCDGDQAILNINFTDYWLVSDSGATFTAIQRPTPIDCQTDPILILVDSAIYATSCDNVGLLRSKDLGTTWTDVSNGLSSNRVCYMERVGGRLFATFPDEIYQAVSGDSVWIPSQTGIPNNSGPFFDLEWDGQRYYVCNGRKVWASVDGIHWVDVSQGLPSGLNGHITYSGMALKDGILFVGTWGQGVWKRPISEITVANEPISPSVDLRLFPNPTSERLYWSTPESVKAFRCFNLFGQAVEAVIIEGYLDVSRWPAGVYVVQATTRTGAVLSGKVLIQR